MSDQLSAGTLLYLFADRMVPEAGRFGGVEAPYYGTKVNAKQLAPLAFAVSIWRLRELGLVTLEKVAKKRLGMFRSEQVVVRPVGQPDLRSGYEDAVLRQLHAEPARELTVWDVVFRWFGQDQKAPYHHALHLATAEMVEQGLARRVDAERGAVAGFLMGSTRVEPLRDEIGRRWTDFEQLQSGWDQFRATEPDLAETLLEGCRKAISSRQESSDD